MERGKGQSIKWVKTSEQKRLALLFSKTSLSEKIYSVLSPRKGRYGHLKLCSSQCLGSTQMEGKGRLSWRAEPKALNTSRTLRWERCCCVSVRQLCKGTDQHKEETAKCVGRFVCGSRGNAAETQSHRPTRQQLKCSDSGRRRSANAHASFQRRRKCPGCVGTSHVSERGGGGGGSEGAGEGGLAGTPLLLGSLYGPAEGGPKIVKLKSSWRRSKNLAVREGREGLGGTAPPLLLRCTAVLIHLWLAPAPKH